MDISQTADMRAPRFSSPSPPLLHYRRQSLAPRSHPLNSGLNQRRLPRLLFSSILSRPNSSPLALLSSLSLPRALGGDEDSNEGAVAVGAARKEAFNVVLVSPQIAGNTGCIARTCAASTVSLHLVEPLGYKIDDAKLKRAGLDYWPYVVVKVHSSWSEFREYFCMQDGEKRLLAFTKRGTRTHSEFSYKPGDWLVFGSETSGLPEEALRDCKNEPLGGGTLRIPMVETYVRCLNLSVSVGIALYEASRQLNYEHFQNPAGPDADNKTLFISEDIFA